MKYTCTWRYFNESVYKLYKYFFSVLKNSHPLSQKAFLCQVFPGIFSPIEKYKEVSLKNKNIGL